jgi:hypothetical protein
MNNRMPPGMGVIMFDGAIVVYQEVEVIDRQQQEGAFGGTVSIPIRTGRMQTVAQIQGTGHLLEMTPALVDAIKADREKS